MSEAAPKQPRDQGIEAFFHGLLQGPRRRAQVLLWGNFVEVEKIEHGLQGLGMRSEKPP